MPMQPDLVMIRRLVRALGLFGLSAASASFGQDGQAVPGTAAASTLEEVAEVVVTGTNIRVLATEVERGALPIEVIDSRELEMTSGENIMEYLRKQTYVSGYNKNRANSPDDDLGTRAEINLRGFGPEYTMVTVDGRRFSNDLSNADIGAIPPDAIESIEVLKAGASTVFGPSAIAGVVDFKLKKEFKGIQLTADFGQASRGDADFKRYSALFGNYGERYRFVGSMFHEDWGGFRTADRKYVANSDLRSFGGHDWRWEGQGSPLIVGRVSRPDERLSLNMERVRPGEAATSIDDFRPFEFDRDARGYNGNAFVEPVSTRKGGHWLAEYDLVEGKAVLYTVGFLDDAQEGPMEAFPLELYEFTDLGETWIIPASNPYNPFGEDVQVFGYTFSDGKNGELPFDYIVDNKSVFASAGVRGELGRYHYDVGVNYFDFRAGSAGNWPGYASIVAALNRTDASALNLLGYWANSPEQVAGITRRVSLDNNGSLQQFEAKVSGPVMALPAGDLKFGLGLEHRQSKLEVTYSPDHIFEEYDFLWLTGDPTSNFERKASAVSVELSAPVYAARDPAAAVLGGIEVGGGVRYEDFSDKGSGATWGEDEGAVLQDAHPSYDTSVVQLSLLVKMLDDSLRLRAFYGGGYRAANPGDLMEPITTTPELVFDPASGEEYIVPITSGGNVSVDAEKAATFTYGLIYSPRAVPALSLNLDFWRLNLENRIVFPSVDELLAGVSDAGSIVRDPGTGRATSIDARLANGGKKTMSGIDFGAGYSWKTAGGNEFKADFAVTYTGKTRVGDRDIGGLWNFGESLPRVRANHGVSWSRGGWYSGLYLTFIKGVRVPIYDPEIGDTGEVATTDDYFTGDLNFAYDFGQSARYADGYLGKLAVNWGVNDVWDAKVPFIDAFAYGYDASIANIRGRYFYAGLKLRL